MTRIHQINDLHKEFGAMPDTYVQPACDVVIIAGDGGNGTQAIEWAKETFTVPVIYVAGNHEFWAQGDINAAIQRMRDCARGSNVHFLYNDTVIIDDVRYIGATLWTDFDLYGNAPLSMFHCKDNKDFDRILKSDGSLFNISDSITEHMLSRFYIETELAKPFDGKTVVVTHHAPTELSVADRFEGSNDNPAYASRLENLILYNDIDYWGHGHVHNSLNYKLGDTTIVCNPRGYYGHHLNDDFDDGLVVVI
jgi:predicted phosphodiesterase